jgi:hypothetical protein
MEEHKIASFKNRNFEKYLDELTNFMGRGQENVDLHNHFPIRLHGVVLN